jgi:hypothetical protein
VRVTASSPVANASFETPEVPTTVPALPVLVGWEHTPKPDWYVEDPSAPETAWANLAGVFPNPAAGSPDHISNLDLKQAAYLFAVPSNGIFQESSAVFEPGVAFRLTIGFVGSASIPPPEGTTLQIGLYYRDSTNRVLVATNSVVYNSTNFPSLTNLVDFTAVTPVIGTNHPAVGKNIGISIISTVAPAGGIWDLDNVRLRPELLRIQSSVAGGNLRLSWPTQTGPSYQLEVSSDLAAWTASGSPIAGTGADVSTEISFTSGTARGFYRLRLLAQP